MTIQDRHHQDQKFFFVAGTAAKGVTRAMFITVGIILSAIFLAATVPSAYAQQTPYYDLSTSEVSVDLSVLNDGGLGAPRTGAMSPAVGGGALLMPGGRSPQSRLFVAPKRKPKLTPKFRKTVKRKSIKKTPRKTKPKTQSSSKRAKKTTRTVPIKTKQSATPPPPPQIASAPKTAAKAPPPPIPTPAPPAHPTTAPTTLTSAKPAAAEPAKQQASIQPTATPPAVKKKPDAGSALIEFPTSSAKVSTAMKSKLKALAAQFKGKTDERLQLKAYAGGKGVSPSKARRLSLSRALAVRSYLISSGVRSTRIDVRALGNKTTTQPINRVDVTIVKR